MHVQGFRTIFFALNLGTIVYQNSIFLLSPKIIEIK